MAQLSEIVVMLGALLQGAFLAGDATELHSYAPPKLEPNPPTKPASVTVVEVAPAEGEYELLVRSRPRHRAPMLGHISAGTRVPVRGTVAVDDERGCPGGVYYAVDPIGWICAAFTQPSQGPATTAPFFHVDAQTLLPYTYRSVLVDEETYIPLWAGPPDITEFAEPERMLARGDSIAIRERTQVGGETYYVTVDGKYAPAQGTVPTTSRSKWQGVRIDGKTHVPFAWAVRKVRVHDRPGGKVVQRLSRRARVDVLEERNMDGDRWLRIGEGRWVNAAHVAEVRRIARPRATEGNRQWLDLDLGEQVVVAYVDNNPVYATLVSSGRAPHATPRGNYPIWAKVSAITMKSQPYDDHPYHVDKVPWVLFFQAHNAFHGAYWHDAFGVTKSHGCANLAPKDARFLFEWLEPKLPPGWTAIRALDLTKAPVVHVHNTHLPDDFAQERNIGPPDPEEEAARLEEAMERRAREAPPSDVLVDEPQGL